jgi:hypothetical protein
VPHFAANLATGNRIFIFYDSENKVWRVPALFTEEGCKDEKASESGDVFLTRGGEETRARGAVLQEAIRDPHSWHNSWPS